jgi:hypothetical protein
VKMFLLRHPVEIYGPEANAFSAHLATREQVSASTHDQALSASLFLYRRVRRYSQGQETKAVPGRPDSKSDQASSNSPQLQQIAHRFPPRLSQAFG